MAQRKKNWKHAAVNPLVFAPRIRMANADGDEVIVHGSNFLAGGDSEMSGEVSPVPAVPELPLVGGGQGREATTPSALMRELARRKDGAGGMQLLVAGIVAMVTLAGVAALLVVIYLMASWIGRGA